GRPGRGVLRSPCRFHNEKRSGYGSSKVRAIETTTQNRKVEETMTKTEGPKPNLIRTSKNRLKLGVFGTNGPGAAFTFHPDRFNPTWDSNLRLAQRADKLGLEAFVSAAHWKAFGGDGHYTGDMQETFTWAGAVSAVTERIAIISTLHVTLIPPIFV